MRASSPVLARPIVALPADFNKDGTADVAVVNKFIDGTFQTGSISVFLGDLGGGLTLASNQTTPGFAQWAALNDFNKDGVPDVAAVTVSAALIFLGNGSGGFHPYTSIPVPFDPIHVSVTDMNADGNSDLVIVQQYIGQPDGRVTVLLGDGAGGFIASTPAITGQDPRAAAVADFNKDGRPDVVTGNNLASSITFLAGLGDGTFAPGVHQPVGVSGGFLTAADFDKSGNLDLIMTSQNVATPALVLLGDGAGGFAVGSVLEAGDTPRNPVLCDFDKDGELDVAIPNAGSADVSVLLGDGAGAFSSAQRVATDGGASQGAIADLNADGFCDLVTANEGGNSISVMLGGVRGVLGTPTTPTGPFPLGAAAADFNADGLPDLAVVSRDDSSVHVYLGDGEGGLTLNSIEPAGVNPGAVEADDFNADGAIDLVVANQGPPGNNQNDSIMVYYNDGNAGFTLGHTLTTGNVPLDIATADFNADQRADIAVSNSQSDRVSYFLAEPFNGFGNAKTVRVGVGTRSLALGDFSGDGILDIAASHMGGSTFTVLQGTGTGFELGPDRSMPTPSPIDMMVSADVNADLVIDLIAVTQPADPFAHGELVTALGVGENNFFFPQPPQPTGTRPEALVVLDLNRTGAFDVVVANRFDNDILTFAGDGTGAFVEGQRFGTGNDP
ncbi:MAG TPA: VCBS repeat-containing protein, partial [Candidatus Polarisedimenticolia bacterium]|nr:VCBS repeat-containing protein [Candidatus Polarisedimenticolia bacterium]